MDINTDPSCSKTTHSDMASSSSLNLDVIMALEGEVQSVLLHPDGPSSRILNAAGLQCDDVRLQLQEPQSTPNNNIKYILNSQKGVSIYYH